MEACYSLEGLMVLEWTKSTLQLQGHLLILLQSLRPRHPRHPEVRRRLLGRPPAEVRIVFSGFPDLEGRGGQDPGW